LELLVVLGIILIIAAIAFPVFGSIRESSFRTNSKTDLRQLWTAISLYSADNEGASQATMLPPLEVYTELPITKTLKPKRLSLVVPITWYYYYPRTADDGIHSDVVEMWNRHVAQCDMKSILLADLNFNAVNIRSRRNAHPVYGLGIRVSGELTEQRKRGFIFDPQWWHCKE
jgi:type II secretory pathway pseudopilin PulG